MKPSKAALEGIRLFIEYREQHGYEDNDIATAAAMNELFEADVDAVHDFLLEACEAAEKWMTPVLEGFSVHDLPANHPVHLARAALAAAKGGQP
jgi:hypothetical protein